MIAIRIKQKVQSGNKYTIKYLNRLTDNDLTTSLTIIFLIRFPSSFGFVWGFFLVVVVGGVFFLCFSPIVILASFLR